MDILVASEFKFRPAVFGEQINWRGLFWLLTAFLQELESLHTSLKPAKHTIMLLSILRCLVC
ncbi:MAG: hypothetical protein A2V67_18125 [Deltaproteobacteria bacterium RBG_13_61_14]|nr:MAG: hypothetical protein A2V67_18125 [Deltaproteobacteria bacterium RBG_13_61_14]